MLRTLAQAIKLSVIVCSTNISKIPPMTLSISHFHFVDNILRDAAISVNRPKCLLLLRVYSFQLHGQSIPPIIEYHGYPCTLLSLRLSRHLRIEINGGSFCLKGYEHVIVINTDVTCFVKRIIRHWDARYANLVWINQQMVHKLPNHKTSLNTKIQVLLNSSLYAVRHIAICTSGIG